MMNLSERMVDEQIAKRGIKDPRVLAAMRRISRELFCPADLKHAAHDDRPLVIGFGQTISQPYIVAHMSEALGLKPTDRVLEIGTGSGYQTAVLAELAAEVLSIEVIPELGEGAQQRLRSLGYKNFEIKIGDGYAGWKEHAPFDAIIVTAAPEEIPAQLIEQLKIGGRMVLPVGKDVQNLTLLTKTHAGIHTQSLIPVRFVPMVEGKGP